MFLTKRAMIQDAYAEAGLAHYMFDLTPEMLQAAARKLNGMMAEWDAKGIRVGYPISSEYGVDDIDNQFNLPDAAYNAAILALSIRIAPQYGKVCSPETHTAAKAAKDALEVYASYEIPDMEYMEGTPTGGSFSYYQSNFMPAPADKLLADDDAELEFNT